MSKYSIQHKVKIEPGKLLLDDVVLARYDPDFRTGSKALHKEYCPDYAKFHKMDNLSRLGFLTAEVLLQHAGEKEQWEMDKFALLLTTAEATTPTDLKYFETVKQIPSPSLFVYTLPNIMMGEIAIRHGIKGENLLLVVPEFDLKSFWTQTETLLEGTNTKWMLGGWVNFQNDMQYESLLYLVAQNRNNSKFTDQIKAVE